MRVSLFITCVSDFLYPNVGKSVVRLLERNNVEVDFPEEQTCCGQPAFNTGYFGETRKAAIHMLRVFRNSPFVVTPSGSCAAMIRHQYPRLFAGDAALVKDAEDLGSRTFEFSEFLVHVLKKTDMNAHVEATATYHHSCHMFRELGVRSEPLELLRNVQGLTLIDLPYAHDCCGFGGTFAVKMNDISAAMVKEKAYHVSSTGANLLVGSDMACLMNIGGYMKKEGIPVRTLHLAELLDEGVRNSENK
jgi:L-lactate dehydrogenase complex protein LldE